MEKKTEEKVVDQSKDFELALKKDHTHNRVEYKAGTKLAVFEPSTESVEYMKKHNIV